MFMKEKLEENKLKKLKEILLDMVNEISKICEEEQIRYFMLGGTHIGAIRHQGFIPWDDDIDIAMPRKDYEKFLKLVEKKLPENLKLYHYSNNDTVSVQFIKIINNKYETVEMKGENGEIPVKNNVFIDIFPFDNLPDNPLERIIFKSKMLLKILKVRIIRLSVIYKDGYKGKNILKKMFCALNKYLKNKDKLIREYKELDSLSKKYIEQDNTKYIINFSSLNFKIIKKETFLRKRFFNFKKYKFEDIELYGIEEYDYYLSKRFGNYMKLPPIEEQECKHFLNIIEKR